MKLGVIAAAAAVALAVLAVPAASGAMAATTMPTISTIAGGIGGPVASGTSIATAATDVAATGGSLFVAGAYGASGTTVVWRINESNDSLAPVAGTGPESGPPPAAGGTPATLVNLAAQQRIGTDNYGNLLLPGDAPNAFKVRVVAQHTGKYYGQQMTVGRIYTVAGNGTQGDTGDGGPAVDAELGSPGLVTGDRLGNLVIADRGNNRIRVVAGSTGMFYGQSMTVGDIYSVYIGSSFSSPQQVVADRWGNLLVTDPGLSQTYVVAEQDGTYYGQAMSAGSAYPIAPYFTSIAADREGNLVVVNSPGLQVLAATTGTFYGQSMTAGNLYTVAGGGSSVASAIPALQALITPQTVAVDQSGNLVLPENGPAYDVRVVAASTGAFYGMSMTAGDIYTIAGNGMQTSSSNGVAAAASQFYNPVGIATDASGNLLIADSGNGVVRAVAKNTGSSYGKQMTAGNVYTIAGGGTVIAANGVPASQAELAVPGGVAVDGSGNVVITDAGRVYLLAEKTGSYFGRQVTAGYIYTLFAGAFSNARVDHYGNLVFATKTTAKAPATVRVFAVRSGTFYGVAMAAGKISTIAGNGAKNCTVSSTGVPAVKAGVCGVADAAVDRSGNVLVTESGSNGVFVVAAKTARFYGQAMKDGYIYRIAGTFGAGVSGNAVPALKAAFPNVIGAVSDRAGNVLIIDGNSVKVLAVATGEFYDQRMRANFVYRIAGPGAPGFAADGTPAAKAPLVIGSTLLNETSAGNILFADNNRIRAISGGPLGP